MSSFLIDEDMVDAAFVAAGCLMRIELAPCVLLHFNAMEWGRRECVWTRLLQGLELCDAQFGSDSERKLSVVEEKKSRQ